MIAKLLALNYEVNIFVENWFGKFEINFEAAQRRVFSVI